MHQSLEPSGILERLSRLERQNSRLRLAAYALLTIIGLYGLMGAAAPSPKTIEAQGFFVVDEAGKRRAELGFIHEPDGVALSLFDKNGKKRVQVSATEEDAGLSLIQDGELRAALTARTGKHVMLLLQKDKFDSKKNQMGFAFDDDGKPRIFINDNDAKTILSLP